MKERLIRQRIFFFIMVSILILLVVIMIWPFMSSILLALAVVVLMKPLYNWFMGKNWFKESENRAAGATIIVFLLLVAIPIFLIVSAAVSQATSLLSELEFEGGEFSLESAITWVEDAIREISSGNLQAGDIQITEGIREAVTNLAGGIAEIAINLGQSLPLVFTSVLIVLVIMAVMLPRYNRPGEEDILEIVPFPKEITKLFLEKIDLMITAMFKGIFVVAIIEGAAMGLVFFIAGVPYSVLLGMLSMFLALLPLIGISLVAWPVGILLILTGDVWQGIFVIAAFLLVISSIDTILRSRLVPKGAYLNPALVILSVLGGIGLMGLIGVIYGPVIMILLVTSIEVYTKYMLRSDLETLDEDGRIDLEELGLAPKEDQEEQEESELLVSMLKNLSARFRGGAQDRGGERDTDEQLTDESADSTA